MKRDEELMGYWLLEQSGEATESQREAVAAWLASDAEAAARVGAFAALCDCAAGLDVPEGPTAGVTDAILDAARERRVRPQGRVLRFPESPAIRWVARAAALLLVLSGWWMLRAPQSDAPIGSDNVEALLLVAVGVVETEPQSDVASGGLDQLADQLLEFQGFGDSTTFEDELISFLQDEPSTAPQAHRTHGFPVGICG